MICGFFLFPQLISGLKLFEILVMINHTSMFKLFRSKYNIVNNKNY